MSERALPRPAAGTAADAVSVSAAGPADGAVLLELVRELAEFEREPAAVVATVADVAAALSGAEPLARALLARGPDGEVLGMALWFRTFSTWTGRPGIWLEDLYVRPAARGRGLGRRLVAELAAECVRRGWPRLEWTVLDWNAAALGFYRALGAEPTAEWTTHRVSGDALTALAGAAPPAGPGAPPP